MPYPYIHAPYCDGMNDQTGAFVGCDCNVLEIKKAEAERDQLRAQLADASRFADEQRIRAESLTVRLESAERERIELRAANKELRHAQDLLINRMAQPSRFRLYIQPRLTPANGGLQIILPSGEVIGHVTESLSDSWIATFDGPGWTVEFGRQADAVDWLTELAQYAAWADAAQGAARGGA